MTPGKTLLLTALALSAVLGSSSGQGACPARCRSCTNDYADCSRSSLIAPPRTYPEGTSTINLERNNIRVLGARTFVEMPSVQVLKISRNRISALTNDAFGRPFPNLVTLDLSANRIGRIYRRALRGMASLQTLKLDRNRIRSLTRIFHGAPNLFQLNLARNRITRVGQSDLAPLTGVRHVDLRDNRISSIHPKAFKELDKLRYLFLNNNPIVSMPLMEWGSQVLQMAELSRCSLTSVPKPFPFSVSELRLLNNNIRQVNHTDFTNMTSLRMLALNDNQIDFFADGTLKDLPQLTEVYLRNNELGYIPRDLPDNLKRLHMESNNVQQIESGIFGANSQLGHISVQGNRVNRIVPNTFSGLRFLNSLDFQGNDLRALETDTFVDLGSLATLMLSSNPLERIDAGAFRNLGNLTHLQLNYIYSETFELGGNFLPEMLRLKTLYLMGSPELASGLMEAIAGGHMTPLSFLEVLDLSYNTLEWLPPRLRQVFPNVRQLLLDGNPLRCSANLRWLADWMNDASSAVQFYRQEEPVCDSPARLRGRPVSSIGATEWAADNEVDVFAFGGGGGRGGGASGGVASDQPQDAPRGPTGTMVRVSGAGGDGNYGGRSGDDPEEEEKEGAERKGSLAKTPRELNAEDASKDKQVGKAAESSAIQTEAEKGAAGSERGQVAKPKKQGRRKGKGGRKRRGRKGKKGKRGKGKGRKRGKKARRDRKNRKNRERKRRRRLTLSTSSAASRKAPAAVSNQQ